MEKIKVAVKNKYTIIVFIFFIVFLGLGIIIFKDYGMSIDEISSRGIGYKRG
jgi:hypothetical protein